MYYFDLITEQIEASRDNMKTISAKQKHEHSPRTDDVKLTSDKQGHKYGLKIDNVQITTAKQAEILHKAKGNYTMITCKSILSHSRTVSDYVALTLSKTIVRYVKESSKKQRKEVCVVGLGNSSLIADSLGSRVAGNLLITRGMPKESDAKLGTLSAFSPGVLGINGIETFDIIAGVLNRVNPDVLIVVDALCASDVQRLGCCFQISDAGIVPGAGIDNARRAINKQTLGMPIIALGVPLMVYARTLCSGRLTDGANELVVTPKDIDFYVKTCAHIIAAAINLAVHGEECFNFL